MKPRRTSIFFCVRLFVFAPRWKTDKLFVLPQQAAATFRVPTATWRVRAMHGIGIMEKSNIFHSTTLFSTPSVI